ncbi:MAG: hypothetical protein F6K14_33805 [Symploca sp. SIO2C1]|nr:hypothetical protein [Symploca sp. SIO2C1]
MSEADTQNNQTPFESTASIDSSEADVLDETEALENSQIVNISALPESQDIIPESSRQQIIDLEDSEPETTESLAVLETNDSVSELPEAQQEQTNDSDLFVLAQKMRQRNRRLLEQVNQLQQALREKQEELFSQRQQDYEHENLLTQKTDELNTVKEQLTRLFHTLESSHQAAQRQQILIETLSEQLESSQQRVAQLERECALTQQRYNEQSHQLLQAANTCRELRARLYRQQRQTLQFKAALEKSLEMTPPMTVEGSQPPLRRKTADPYSLPKTQPIQPWSSEDLIQEAPSNVEPLWQQPIRFALPLKMDAAKAELTDVISITETEQFSLTDPSDSVDATFAGVEESVAQELQVEKEILEQMNSLAEAFGLSEPLSHLAEPEGDLSPKSETNQDEADELDLYLIDTEEFPLSEDTGELDNEAQIPSEESREDTENMESDPLDEVLLPQSSWPSPVLYPLRRPKKLKSLAAIDLPSFPRYGHS